MGFPSIATGGFRKGQIGDFPGKHGIFSMKTPIWAA
jgi:hypothetical protein